MARIRTIKPQFFLNDVLAQLPSLDRLLFIGLWTLADREGRLDDNPVRIKIQTLPYDTIDVDSSLTSLEEKKFILRYEIKGNKYIQIINFLKHQQPHYKEVESLIPPPKGHKDSPYVTFGVSKEQRYRIMRRDGYKCITCGSEKQLSIDHIVPRSAGGTGDDENLQVLCLSCNSSKNNKLAGELSGQRRVNVGSILYAGREGKGKERKDIYTPDFEEFWKECLKREDKKYAFTCYQKRLSEGITSTQILEHIKAYSKKHKAEKTEVKFIKNPSSFLNKTEFRELPDYPINAKGDSLADKYPAL